MGDVKQTLRRRDRRAPGKRRRPLPRKINERKIKPKKNKKEPFASVSQPARAGDGTTFNSQTGVKIWTESLFRQPLIVYGLGFTNAAML